MAQRDLLNRSIEAGKDVTQRTQERLESLVQELVRLSEAQAQAAQELLTEMVDRSRDTTEKVMDSVDREVRTQIANLGLATQEDIRRLESEIASLRKGAAPKKAAAKKSSAKKASKKAPAKKKAAAKRPAAGD